jgi:hypothetical protein
MTDHKISSEILNSFEVVTKQNSKNKERLQHHENFEAIQLLENRGIVRRIQRKKPLELV